MSKRVAFSNSISAPIRAAYSLYADAYRPRLEPVARSPWLQDAYELHL